MFDSPPTTVALISVASVLLISGIGVSYLLGRRTGRSLHRAQDEDDFRLPERVANELLRCLELGDYVTRDADALAALAAAQPGGTPRPVNLALQQLVKTTKSLVGRLNRVGAAARIARPGPVVHTVGLPALSTDSNPSAASDSHLRSFADSPASSLSLSTDDAEVASHEARRFPRSAFRGAAWATIYPVNATAGREPLRCEVLTRDLSCGGIGIAHTEPLFPKQIIVLDAVGKLLVSEVRWCRRVDENYYVAGCRLVKTSG